MLPGTCPSWAFSLESGNPALVPSGPPLGPGTTLSLGTGFCDTGQGSTRGRIRPGPDFQHWRPWGHSVPAPSIGGWASPGQLGCRAPFSAPSSGARRHLHTFRLARCSPFRPPRFQLLIWKRKKKPAGWGRPQGGNRSRSAAPAPPASGARCRRISALPRPGPRPPRCPPRRPSPSSRPLPAPNPSDPGPQTWRLRGTGRGPCREGGPGLCRGRSPPGALLSRNPSPSRGAPPGVNLLCVPK